MRLKKTQCYILYRFRLFWSGFFKLSSVSCCWKWMRNVTKGISLHALQQSKQLLASCFQKIKSIDDKASNFLFHYFFFEKNVLVRPKSLITHYKVQYVFLYTEFIRVFITMLMYLFFFLPPAYGTHSVTYILTIPQVYYHHTQCDFGHWQKPVCLFALSSARSPCLLAVWANEAHPLL